ncbi:hypothetical protein TNCV_3573101 [Trichonephila clavipes]|nr:hypothetical protein TNCV_3573101 [Trichonephila clavipes]
MNQRVPNSPTWSPISLKWSPKSPRSPKMMPTWLYHQDFSKFSLNFHYSSIYRVSPKAVYKFGWQLENILMSHNYIGKHRWKRNPNEESSHPWRQTEKSAKPEQDGAKRNRQWREGKIVG